ncbi:hypothetical protein A2U01_0040155, partial [Trifolium medium]|nr:hypothetical protein [Trifolium medium]
TLIIIDLDVIEDKCDLIGHHPLSLPDDEPCSHIASSVDSNSCHCK